MKKKTVNAEIHDLYQLLIAECRYGYTRNNHLMPDGAYDHVKEYLPLMLDVDKDLALHTACQLCEECISDELVSHFYDGLDDEHESRKKAIEFIEYLLKWIDDNSDDKHLCRCYQPYNLDQYRDCINRADNLKYKVFELDEYYVKANRIRELTKEPLTREEAENLLFKSELGMQDGDTIFTNLVSIKTDKYPQRIIGTVLRILDPHTKKGKVYSIELESSH